MSTELITVTAETPLNKLRPLFKRRNVHHILVENNIGQLSGIISEVDLARSAHFPVREDQLLAKHIMTASPEKITTDLSIRQVTDYFLDNKFRAIPIVGKGDKLIGIVTPYDIMSALMDQFEEEEEADTHFDNV